MSHTWYLTYVQPSVRSKLYLVYTSQRMMHFVLALPSLTAATSYIISSYIYIYIYHTKVDGSGGEGGPASTEDSPDTTSRGGGGGETPEHLRLPTSPSVGDGARGAQETTLSIVDEVDRVSDDATKGGDGASGEKQNVEGGGSFAKALDAEAEMGGEGGGGGGGGGGAGGGGSEQDGLSPGEHSSSKAKAGRPREEHLHGSAIGGDGADRPWTTDSNSAVASEEVNRPGGYGDIDEYRLPDKLADDEQVSEGGIYIYIYIYIYTGHNNN